ncbi:hypothetical protein [Leptolyngbya ohadii]|uniref:hypothetical protein n=1 Tax=Leptolyngbya ohadii TaxID=1962290 RepID=UPI000B59949C|nr:hypothetical protein [Leptolyngbya ohadii]
MSEFGHGNGNAFGHDKDSKDPKDEGGIDLAGESQSQFKSSSGGQGSDLQEASLDESLSKALEDPVTGSSGEDNQDSGSDAGSNEANHFSPDQLANPRGLDPNQVERVSGDVNQFLGETGDLLDGKGGTNTIIAGGDDDVIKSDTEGAFNTIATGFGNDVIVLGLEATADVLDFDTNTDKFALGEGLTLDRIIYGQGQNPDKGGLEQPLDSENNTLILDRDTGHTLAATRFTIAEDFSEKNFVVFDESAAPDLVEQS